MAIKLFGISLGKNKVQKGDQVKKNIYTDPSFGDLLRKGNSYTTQKDQLNAYGDVGWVAVAVDCIATDIGSRGFYFVDRVSQEPIDDDRVPEAIMLPLQNGFGNLSFQQLNAITSAHKILTGNALYLKMKTSMYGLYKGMDEQLAFIPPSRFKVITSRTGLQLQGYEITFEDGTFFTAKPDQVIHLSQSNLKSAFKGMGAIEKIRQTIEGEVYSDDFSNEFMARKASPSLAIVDKGNILDDQFERTKDILRQEYEGRQNSGKILYLAGSEISITELGLSQRDIQFIEKKGWDRQTILSIFRVPPVRAGVPDNANRAISDQQLTQYYKDINAHLTINADQINKQFVWPLDPNIELKFDLFSTAEVDLIIRQVQAGLISPNRGSELIGEATDWNDEMLNKRYMLSGYMPIDSLSSAPAPITPSPDQNQAGKGSKKKAISDPRKVDEIVDIFYGDQGIKKTRKHQAQFLRTALNSRNEVEKRYTGHMVSFFEKQKDRVIKAFNDHFKSDGSVIQLKAEPDRNSYRVIFDLEAENDELKNDIRPLHTSAVQRSIMDLNRLADGAIEYSLSNPFVKNAIARLGSYLVDELKVNGFTQDQLKELMIQGINESWNINEYQKAITAKFEMFEGYRARMIARTESRAGYDAGAQIAYKELGVDTIDIVGCTMFEPDSDCGATDVPVDDIKNLVFHPNHIGSPVPSKPIGDQNA